MHAFYTTSSLCPPKDGSCPVPLAPMPLLYPPTQLGGLYSRPAHHGPHKSQDCSGLKRPTNSREEEEEWGEGHPRGQLSTLDSGRISELASTDWESYPIPSVNGPADLTVPQRPSNDLAQESHLCEKLSFYCRRHCQGDGGGVGDSGWVWTEEGHQGVSRHTPTS